jgi:hypothetical protein
MTTQITDYINSQSDPKRSDMLSLHALILRILPAGKLWFEDGKNSEGKVISNPTIGYGSYTAKYANGKTRDAFQIGMSANTSGISIYIMGLGDKAYLADTYSKELGKATVTGYCIRFKQLKDVNVTVLEEAIRYGIAATRED